MSETRTISPNDIDLICRHRHAMFAASGKPRDAELAAMAAPFREWLAPRLMDGSYFGFVVETADTPIASIGLMIIDWPPHPLHPTDDRRGYVLNMFVEPKYRGQGIARDLLQRADNAFAERGIQYAVLHATGMGRSLYENNGWQPTPEMAKIIESDET